MGWRQMSMLFVDCDLVNRTLGVGDYSSPLLPDSFNQLEIPRDSSCAFNAASDSCFLSLRTKSVR